MFFIKVIMMSSPFETLLGLALLICTMHTSSACSEGQACSTSDGNTGICLSQRCLSLLPIYTRENLTFVITVKYPEEMLQVRIQ